MPAWHYRRFFEAPVLPIINLIQEELNMKRKFSLLVAAACLFSSLTFGGVAHADTPSSFTDVTNKTQYYEGIMTLTKLGIINGYTEDNGATYSFKPEGEITRAEFSKIIITALGADASVGSSDKFTDIDSHWAKGFIIAAADRGIVNGMGDGTFEPDSKVTYEQAVKMIVCAAGYENQAQAFGGWPKGYLAQADNLGITKDAVSANTTAPAARGIIAQLMYNVLDVDVPEYDINGSLKKDLKTFMATYLGIIKEKATIVGVEDKKLASFAGTLYIDEMAVMLRDGTFVTMDYTSYTDDKSVLEERIGQSVVVYYIEGKSGAQNSLYELDFESSKNTVTVVNSEDISDYSGNTLKYYDENDKLRSFSIDPSTASVYYNGKLAASPASKLAAVLDPAQGTFMYGEVKLTDSGSDKSIDIVEITDYDYLVVAKTPSTTDYAVSNKVKFTGTAPDGYLSTIYLDPDSISYTVDITNASGANVSVTSLKANDVLLVAQSEDSSIKKVVVCPAPVSGKITATSGSTNAVTIGGKEYTISDYAQQYFTENGIKTDTGSQGTFYVDTYGTIVYATQTAVAQGTSPYVYIIRAVVNDDEETGTITVYVPSTGVKQFSVSGKIKYNGTSLPVASVIEELRNNIPSDSTTVNVAAPDNGTTVYTTAPTLSNAGQIARITYSGTNLEEIAVAEPGTYPNSGSYTSTEDNSGIVPYAPLEKRTYKSNSFRDKDTDSIDFVVNSSTTFIYVPQDRTKNNEYAKRSTSSFKTGNQYWVQPYNVNGSKIADLVVLYGKETQTTNVKNDTQVYLLAQDHSTVVENDEQVYQVSYYANSDEMKEKSASVSENLVGSVENYTPVDVSDIKMGDFFRAGTDSTTGFVNAQKLIDYDDVKSAIAGNCDFTSSSFYFTNSYIDLRVFNVIEVTEDNGKYMLRVTADGFDNGVLPEENYDLITVDSSVVIYRVSDDGSKVTPYLEGSDSERVTALELGEAKYEGTGASKIAVYRYTGTAGNTKQPKMIFIYE